MVVKWEGGCYLFFFFDRVALLFVGHGHHSQHEVDEVEGAKENEDYEKGDVPGASCTQQLNTTQRPNEFLLSKCSEQKILPPSNEFFPKLLGTTACN